MCECVCVYVCVCVCVCVCVWVHVFADTLYSGRVANFHLHAADMKAQKVHLPQPTQSLGETISVPAQAHLYIRQSHMGAQPWELDLYV